MGLIFTDIPELEGSKTEIALANLSDIEPKFAALVEKRLAHLCELSDAVIDDGEDFDIIKSILLSMKSDGDTDDEDIISVNKDDAELLYSKVSLAERLILYRYVAQKFFVGHREDLLYRHLETGIQVKKEAADKIAYLKNSFNDEAYLKLSTVLKHPKAVYYNNTEDVCRAVSDGICEYCILPVEATGTKLPAFYGMMIKYGFLKCAEYEMITPDGYTRYSLLCKGRFFDKNERSSRLNQRLAEFMLNAEDTACLSDVLTACEFSRMRLRRIDTVGGLICVNLILDKSDIETFMTYVAIECPGMILLGIYKQI